MRVAENQLFSGPHFSLQSGNMATPAASCETSFRRNWGVPEDRPKTQRNYRQTLPHQVWPKFPQWLTEPAGTV
jgi:hypothetical protein